MFIYLIKTKPKLILLLSNTFTAVCGKTCGEDTMHAKRVARILLVWLRFFVPHLTKSIVVVIATLLVKSTILSNEPHLAEYK